MGVTKHNLTGTYIYGQWYRMLTKAKKNNIKVCDIWLDIANFNEDSKSIAKEGLTISLINKSGIYEPSNCKWIPTKDSHKKNKPYKNNSTGYKGVSKQKFIARIRIDKKLIHIGIYDTCLEAAKAYDKYIEDNGLAHAKNFN